MRKKDIALIAVVVIVAGVFSLLISNLLISPESSRQAEVEVVGPITSEFVQPSDAYFNGDSVNPTQIIRIGEGVNPNPLSPGQN